jgi:hypothetical protein
MLLCGGHVVWRRTRQQRAARMAFFQCTPAYVVCAHSAKHVWEGRASFCQPSHKSGHIHYVYNYNASLGGIPQQAQGSCAWPRLTRLWFPLHYRHEIPATTPRLSVRETSIVTATKGVAMAREGLGHPRTPTATEQTRRLRTTAVSGPG